MFKGTPEFQRAKGTAVASVLEALGRALQRDDLVRPDELLRDDPLGPARGRRADRGVADAAGAAARRGPRSRDDRRPQRVRAGRELAVPGPLQAHLRDGVPRASVPPPDDRVAQRHRGASRRTRLREFYDTFYHPNNATAMVIGDFEEDAALALIARHFGAIPASPQPIPRVYTVEPPQEGERRFVVRRVGQVAWCGLSWRTVEAVHPDTPALAVLGNILGGGHHVAPPPGAGREEPGALGLGRAVAAARSGALLGLRAGAARAWSRPRSSR